MLKTLFVSLAFCAIAFGQSGPAPATYRSAAELMEALKADIPKARDQASASIFAADNWHASVVYRNHPGVAMAHATGPAKGTEVHYIMDGSATVITGGTLLRPAGGPTDIQGGVVHHVTKGDALVIPAGTPHWYKEIQGSVTYLEIRFDVEKDKK